MSVKSRYYSLFASLWKEKNKVDYYCTVNYKITNVNYLNTGYHYVRDQLLRA